MRNLHQKFKKSRFDCIFKARLWRSEEVVVCRFDASNASNTSSVVLSGLQNLISTQPSVLIYFRADTAHSSQPFRLTYKRGSTTETKAIEHELVSVEMISRITKNYQLIQIKSLNQLIGYRIICTSLLMFFSRQKISVWKSKKIIFTKKYKKIWLYKIRTIQHDYRLWCGDPLLSRFPSLPRSWPATVSTFCRVHLYGTFLSLWFLSWVKTDQSVYLIIRNYLSISISFFIGSSKLFHFTGSSKSEKLVIQKSVISEKIYNKD